MPIEVTRVPSLSVPEPARYTGAAVGPAAANVVQLPLDIARRKRIRSARLYLTTLATGAPGGPVAVNALNPTQVELYADGVLIGSLDNGAAAIANGASIPVATPDLAEGAHLVAVVDNTPAGAENWSALRVTVVLEVDPR